MIQKRGAAKAYLNTLLSAGRADFSLDSLAEKTGLSRVAAKNRHAYLEAVSTQTWQGAGGNSRFLLLEGK